MVFPQIRQPPFMRNTNGNTIWSRFQDISIEQYSWDVNQVETSWHGELGRLRETSIVSVLTLRFYLKNTYENNQREDQSFIYPEYLTLRTTFKSKVNSIKFEVLHWIESKTYFPRNS